MKKLTLILAVALLTLPAVALTPDQIAQQQLIIQQQQEQARQAEAARRELREAENVRDTREAADEEATPGEDSKSTGADGQTGADADCSRFGTIEVLGNKIYSNTRIRKITDRYINRCITRDNMTALQNDLTALYIDRKYTLARVYFDQRRSNLTLGDSDIVFIVEEGIINTIDFRDEYPPAPLRDSGATSSDEDQSSQSDAIPNGNAAATTIADEPIGWWSRWRNATKKYTAMPATAGEVFNLKDFEQALDQLNRLQSNNATMDIRPTAGLDAAGHSDIIIANKHNSRRTTFIGAGIDNTGNKSTGTTNWNVNLNQDNLLALNDNLYLKYSHDTDYAGGHHHNQSVYSALSIPFGYWTASASLSWSDYLSTVEGLYTSFHTSGDTLTQTYSLDRVLYRSAKYRTQLGAAFQLRDTENWIRDMKSITGSRRASNINVFWNNTIYHPWGILIVKPSYQRGLNLFGSRKDPSDIWPTEPHLQYDMAKLYIYSSMKFDIGVPLTWNLTADGQYSFQNLYGTDQLSLGGEYTVRGFRDSTISGDYGFYVRNDFRVPLGNLIPSFITDTRPFQWFGNWSLGSALDRTSIAVFGDYGQVYNAYKIMPDPYHSNKGEMAGVGAGLYYSGKYLNWSLMYSQGLMSPEYLQTRDGIPEEERSIYWRITANF
ncbi:MAG: ShlB/FhaC/HecB family hemolysin secretion/activation protein [Rickettsiales bacterium]|jgi:hemolysin activation/secretion protein|nr:ShlB/FhaC/HecB family hemolysin secretion/activation protein [Rickettsiales bacterium]